MGAGTLVASARRTGIEPATSGSTVRCSNQLSYRPVSGTPPFPGGGQECRRGRGTVKGPIVRRVEAGDGRAAGTACAAAPTRGKSELRRATALDNVKAARRRRESGGVEADGKCHRKDTAVKRLTVRVKWCGKSAPRSRRRDWQGKPRRQQDPAAARRFPGNVALRPGVTAAGRSLRSTARRGRRGGGRPPSQRNGRPRRKTGTELGLQGPHSTQRRRDHPIPPPSLLGNDDVSARPLQRPGFSPFHA